MERAFFRSVGSLSLALGVAGTMVPLLPTTVFLIIAAACFLRSDPERAERLYAHPQFGPTLRAWRDHGAISRRGKTMAVFGIGASFAIVWLTAGLDLRAIVAIAAVLTAVSIYILTRPTAPRHLS